jgi:transposase
MRRIRDRVAGLDVHRDTIVACTRVVEGDRTITTAKRKFSTTRKGLGELIVFLADAEVTTVAMEATGVYWKAPFYALEGIFDEVWLCNAAHVKNVPGRKTDLSDAEWLADVAAHGMVRPSFVPPPDIRELRELTRYRKTQIDARARELQRLEKVLQDAGVKITSVASRVWSKTSRAIIEAMIAGERDPKVLAGLAKTALRAKTDQLEEAVPGTFGVHHGVVCRQIIDHVDFLDGSIAALTAEITARLVPFEGAVAIITSVTGIQKATAEVFVAEVGVDMTKFPTAGHLGAWSGLAPASNESAGKHRPAGTLHGAPWLHRAMVEAARSAARTRGSYYSVQAARIAKRRGPNKAAVAVAHSMITTIWHLLTNGQLYEDPGADYFIRRHDPDVEAKRLARRIEALGYDVSLTQKAA